MPVKWKDARSAGLQFYFTGRPCHAGHIANRYVSDRGCVVCRDGQSRTWQAANRECENARVRRYRATHPQESRAATRKWRKQNPETFRRSYSSWRLRNLERARAAVKHWEQQNPEARRASAHSRRCRELGAEGFFCAGDIDLIRTKQGNRCGYCRSALGKSAFNIDHIIALARGGSNWPKNLQLLCPQCNRRKHARDPLVFARQLGMLL